MQPQHLHLQAAILALRQRVASPWTSSRHPGLITPPRLINRIAICALTVAVSACNTSQPAHLPASGVNGPNGGSEETIHYDEAGHPHFL